MGRIRGVKNRATGTVGDAYYRSRRRARRFFIDTENTKLVIGFVTIAVALSLAVPTLFPELKRSGPDCLSLMSPPGGNQRSMLAENGDTRQDLKLILDIDANQSNDKGDPLVKVGESLIVDVVLQNEDIGAITFYFVDDAVAIGSPASPDSVGGIYLEIRNKVTNQPYSDSLRQGVPANLNSSFDYEDLHVIQSRRRCSVRVIFEPQQLAGMNMGVGEYEIRAYYNNPNRGPIPAFAPDGSTPTATPMFQDQGVWKGRITSKVVTFEISP
ncbi:MAG: hypothetical protein HY862_16965 [Chloroflexi bacterium]|nr:hypothetical protein [Chloroflexota bacterium]